MPPHVNTRRVRKGELISINASFFRLRHCHLISRTDVDESEGTMTTTEAEIDHLRSDIQKLRSDIEQLGTTLSRVARASMREAGESVSDATEDLRAEACQTAKRFTDKIEENPVAAAVAALGLGMLLGRICAGRRD